MSSQPPTKEQLAATFAQIEARERQREQQQGLGRPIVSTMLNGWRVVAIGNRVAYSKSWVTFHDFLLYYINDLFGQEWWGVEMPRTGPDVHPLIRWRRHVQEFLNNNRSESGQTSTAEMIGAVRAYLGLAYQLYLLAHNATLQHRLIARLRRASQFEPAAYETFVAAAFINAGLRLELEDESDANSTHCEFTATHSRTGRRFSVEAKWRAPGKNSAKVANQLHEALKKATSDERIIFIELSAMAATADEVAARLHEAVESLRAKEQGLSVASLPAPPAYVVLTNQTYLLDMEGPAGPLALAAEGFKIPDFKFDLRFPRLHDALAARARHREVFDLVEAIHTYKEIPTTFDGEIPEFAFGTQRPRLLVGHKYQIPTEHGVFLAGTLETGTVSLHERKAMCSLKLEDGQRILASFDLTTEEMSAYRRHPETFFGVHISQATKADNPIELYDWFLSVYGKTPKDKLLELLKGHPEYHTFASKEQPELAAVYSEAMAEAAQHQTNQPR